MRTIIVTSMVGCVMAGADRSDRPVGVIRAGARTARKAGVTSCEYCSSSGDSLCAYLPAGVSTTGAVELKTSCRLHDTGRG